MLEAIIFDMDGVLIKSEGAISTSFNMVLKKYGVSLKPEYKKKFLGRSLKDQLEIIKEEHPKIPRDLNMEEFSKEAFQYQLKILAERLIPDITILNIINEAKNKKIKIAVATSSVRYRAEELLKSIGVLGLLDVLVTSEDVKNQKPHPDIFLETAKKLRVSPENCLVIEDAVNGIQAANSAGMKSVGLITKNHPKEDFTEANHIFSNFKELRLKDLENLF
ncbi:MAG: HAD family phosphatase [Candidatus Yonathbacteria bacterium]|nr:HAD family phosphatase [Candidatus Yonathbacteria bacterium]NTW47600.1 HAD family phosphatase [Candidatus Yonathbacteria bacterium]